jgi:drug/metabolite transporter (DMT)-like permease
MLGFVYALAAAFFSSTSDALCKKALDQHTPLLTAWVRFAYTTPFLAVSLFFVDLPPADRTFWELLAVLVPLEILAVILYMRALKMSSLSLTVPFLALTPAFTLASSFLLLGEVPDRSGLAGILLIVLGAYLLNVHLSREGVLEPLRAIVRERGSLLMIGVAFLYSITSNMGKLAIQHSSAAFMSVVYLPILSLAFLPLLLRARVQMSDLRRGGTIFFLIGASQAIMAFCHFHAVALILVSYMISVKRLGLVLSVVFGKVFFHEAHVKERILGSCMMLFGVMLILI